MSVEVYVPSVETDALLLQWWARMNDAGELETIFPSFATPSAFLAAMQVPTAVLFDHDTDGITVAVWCTALLHSAALSLWVRKDYRHRRWVHVVIDALRTLFTAGVRLIVFVSELPHVIRAAQDVHFEILGQIPSLVSSAQNATIGFLTVQQFEVHYGTTGSSSAGPSGRG